MQIRKQNLKQISKFNHVFEKKKYKRKKNRKTTFIFQIKSEMVQCAWLTLCLQMRSIECLHNNVYANTERWKRTEKNNKCILCL